MADKTKHPTPNLDQLEEGPWPSFVTGLKRLRDHKDSKNKDMMKDLLGQLEQKVPRETINEFLDEIHRPALPYKFKCPLQTDFPQTGSYKPAQQSAALA